MTKKEKMLLTTRKLLPRLKKNNIIFIVPRGKRHLGPTHLRLAGAQGHAQTETTTIPRTDVTNGSVVNFAPFWLSEAIRRAFLVICFYLQTAIAIKLVKIFILSEAKKRSGIPPLTEPRAV